MVLIYNRYEMKVINTSLAFFNLSPWEILFIVLLVGFWGCEEEPKDCAGVAGGDNICGCTDSLAINFDNTATYDDESCEYDTTPPNITITFNAEGSVSEMVSISCISTDNESIEKVELWINGVATSVTDTAEPYSLEWNTTLYENGSYVITVRSYDTSGNVTDSDRSTTNRGWFSFCIS